MVHHLPRSIWESVDPVIDKLEWDDGTDADDHFTAWKEGRTGFPYIDAGMRQLLAEGWMHNRVRMGVASFLIKDLHLPWQWGARHFLDHLVDGDYASNNHGWQWVAGSGPQATPFFRIFNPQLQAEKFDPKAITSASSSRSCAGSPARRCTARGNWTRRPPTTRRRSSSTRLSEQSRCGAGRTGRADPHHRADPPLEKYRP